MKVAFIGNNILNEKVNTDLLEKKVENIVEKLILEDGADEFIFGAVDGFDCLCYIVVTKLMNKYPNIRRIYVSQFANPSNKIKKWMNDYFEQCEYPLPKDEMGDKPNIKRNEIIVDKSDLIIAYYDKSDSFKFNTNVEIKFFRNGTTRMSKTKIALNYAYNNNKKLVNLFEN